MSEPATRPVLILDDDGELFGTLALLEEVLIHLQPFDDDEPATPGLGPDELLAVDRVLMQLHAAEQSGCANLYGPDGFHYGRLPVFCPLVEDLEGIGRSFTAIRDAARSGHRSYVGDAIEAATGMRAEDFSDRVDRAYRTLSVKPDEDQRLLCRIVTEHTGNITLDADQEHAYRRWVSCLLDSRGKDPLERFVYLGSGSR